MHYRNFTIKNFYNKKTPPTLGALRTCPTDERASAVRRLAEAISPETPAWREAAWEPLLVLPV